jgi:prolyl-tRNA editing enzyme YbaK/EbsC (Cys-tRNA(Pro) deacylase)
MDVDAEASVARSLAELGAVEGTDYEVMECDPDFADTAAFCERYGVTPEESANCIVVIGKSDPPVFAACVVTADRRLDVNGLVKRMLGTRKASFASADQTRELTGMIIGGVTPFRLPQSVPLWIDSFVMEQPSVVVGGGSRSQKLRLAPDLLARLPAAEVIGGLARRPE